MMFPVSMFTISTLSLMVLSRQNTHDIKYNHVIKAIMFLLQIISALYLRTIISLL